LEDVVVGIGDMKVAKGDVEIVTYALGSCVGVCVYDEALGLGGMLHALLPASPDDFPAEEKYKYVDTGLDGLIDQLCIKGADRSRLKAKLVGGAKMFEYVVTIDGVDIGTANVVQAKRQLKEMGIKLAWEVTGGEVGRTIRFRPPNGAVKIMASDNTTEVV